MKEEAAALTDLGTRKPYADAVAIRWVADRSPVCASMHGLSDRALPASRQLTLAPGGRADV